MTGDLVGRVEQRETRQTASHIFKGSALMHRLNMKIFLFGLAVLIWTASSGCSGGGSSDSPSGYVIPDIPVDPLTYTFRALTVDEETEYVWNLLQNYRWYQTNGYTISLPNHTVVTNLITKSLSNISFSSSDYSDLQNAMSGIYNSNDYQLGLNKLHESKTKILACFPVFLDYHAKWAALGWNFKTFPNYAVCLTLYGPGGSYDSNTGTIIMLVYPNGTFKQGADPVPPVVHETTHIAIEDEVITRYTIAHWTKERIIDKFCYYHFRQIITNYKMQTMGDVSIDPYVDRPDSWERLPDYVGRYASGLPPK